MDRKQPVREVRHRRNKDFVSNIIEHRPDRHRRELLHRALVLKEAQEFFEGIVMSSGIIMLILGMVYNLFIVAAIGLVYIIFWIGAMILEYRRWRLMRKIEGNRKEPTHENK